MNARISLTCRPATVLTFLVPFVVSMLAVLPGQAGAQDKAAAIIEYSSGDDIVVIRAGKRVPADDPIGMALFSGDQVQTGRGVFVELRLAGGSSVIKLAENTTFVLERVAGGQTSLRLVYGRLRAKVEKLAGSDSFSVASAQAIAGVRGTDFGVDVIASRGKTAGNNNTRAYCFEGSVQVTAFVKTDATAKAGEGLEPVPKVFMVEPGQMVSVEGDADATGAVQSPIETQILEYWQDNDYVGQTAKAIEERTGDVDLSAIVMTPVAPEAPPSELELEYRRGFEEGYRASKKEAQAASGSASGAVPAGFVSEAELAAMKRAMMLQKAGVIAAGMATLGGAAMAIDGYIDLQNGNQDQGISSLAIGAAISAASLPFLVLSLFAAP